MFFVHVGVIVVVVVVGVIVVVFGVGVTHCCCWCEFFGLLIKCVKIIVVVQPGQ